MGCYRKSKRPQTEYYHFPRIETGSNGNQQPPFSEAKYREIEENEVRFEEINCEDAEYLIIAFGSMARIGQKAMELAREKGIKVGILRPITLWPFPTKAIAAYADKVKGMLVTELNAGQMIEDVRLAVNGKVKVEHFGRLGGIVPDPDEIVTAWKKNNVIRRLDNLRFTIQVTMVSRKAISITNRKF